MAPDLNKSTLRLVVLSTLFTCLMLTLSGCQPDPKISTATFEAALAAKLTALPSSTAYPTFTAQASQTPFATYTPASTATRYPTYTPLPSHTLNPTYTALPTLTNLPTNTKYPTYTPLATNTRYPTQTQLPSYTPFPTSTAYPTFTRLPSYTPHATSTDYPTHTPAPTYTEVVRIVMVTPTTDESVLKAPKGDGFFLVGPEIAHGIWRSEGEYNKCYWKVTDIKGNIISNFIGTAGGTVYLDENAYQIEIRNCGKLKFYSPIN